MKANYLLGIDIGGTKCAVILGDEIGTVHKRYAFPTQEQGGPYEVKVLIAGNGRELTDQVKEKNKEKGWLFRQSTSRETSRGPARYRPDFAVFNLYCFCKRR